MSIGGAKQDLRHARHELAAVINGMPRTSILKYSSKYNKIKHSINDIDKIIRGLGNV